MNLLKKGRKKRGEIKVKIFKNKQISIYFFLNLSMKNVSLGGIAVLLSSSIISLSGFIKSAPELRLERRVKQTRITPHKVIKMRTIEPCVHAIQQQSSEHHLQGVSVSVYLSHCSSTMGIWCSSWSQSIHQLQNLNWIIRV